MSVSQDGSDGIVPEVLPGTLGEPSNDAPPQNDDDPTPPPGSLALFRDGGFKFPKALLVVGGFNILSNPICKGLREWFVSESILELNTSI